VASQSKFPDPAHVVMPAAHRVAPLLNRDRLGTFNGAVGNDPLNHHIDEYTSRFDRRGSASRGLLFCRIIKQVVRTDSMPAHALFRGTAGGKQSGKGIA
jgi:hypothetical protein